MSTPQIFNQLVVDNFAAYVSHLRSENEVRHFILRNMTLSQKRELHRYLGQILDGRFTDAELTVMWNKVDADFRFFEPNGVRVFLTHVVTWLSDAGS